MVSSFFKHSLAAASVATAVIGMTGVVGVNSAQALTVIDTAPSWDGSSSISSWGVPDTSTYGQTFTITGSDNVLQSFSFQIGRTSAPIPYAAYVAEWAGGPNGSIVGSLLFQSAPSSFSNLGDSFQQLIINTGGVQLTSGKKYVAFLSTSGLQSGQPSSTTNFGSVWGNDYVGGEFVFYNTGDDFAPLLTTNWQTFIEGDLAFEATLTEGAQPIPTPALLPGLIGMGIATIRKRKGEAAQESSEA